VLRDMLSYFPNHFKAYQDAVVFDSKNTIFDSAVIEKKKEESILSHLSSRSIDKIEIVISSSSSSSPSSSSSSSSTTSKQIQTRLPLNELTKQIALFHMRAIWFKIDESLMKKINKLTKEHNVKINAFLTVVISLAYKKLYQKYCSNDQDKNQEIHYGYTMSLRQFANNAEFGPSAFENLGTFINYFINKIDKRIDMMNDDDWSGSFWPLVIDEHQKLVDMQKRNQHMLSLNPQFNEHAAYDYWLTNLGKMSSLYSSTSKHKVTSCRFYTSCPPEQIITFHNLITIDNQLFWSIVYNSIHFTEAAAKQITQTIDQIILKIVE
jgi:hypothetical protein